MVRMRAELARLIAHERKRRCWFWAAIALFYGVGWLALSRHATRVGEAECTIQRVPAREGKCTAAYRGEDGREHTSQWDDCEKPTRWTVPVGASVHCWYYRTYPDNVRLEPLPVEPNPPVAFAFVGAGVILFLVGIVFARRASSALPTPSEDGAPYRAPSPRDDPPPAPPRRILLSGSPGFVRWALGLAFGPLGLLFLGVLAWTLPTHSGPVHVMDAVVVTVGLLTTYAGFAAIGYRAGIDVDVSRGILVHWWGLWRPWRRRYAALASLQHAEVKVVRGSRGGSYTELRVTFEGRKTWRSVCEHAASAAGALVAARDARRDESNPG